MWFVAGADGTGRQVALYDANGELIQQSEFNAVKNDTYYFEFTTVEAGSYYLGNEGGSNLFFKIEVVVE